MQIDKNDKIIKLANYTVRSPFVVRAVPDSGNEHVVSPVYILETQSRMVALIIANEIYLSNDVPASSVLPASDDYKMVSYRRTQKRNVAASFDTQLQS